MLQNLRKRNEGFTIIEVLIVLAIAGLILLVVFLAVPALQRNSRNTQRKSDVQAALGAVTDYMSNNAGSLPTGYDATAKAITGTGTSAGLKLGYYTTVSVGAGALANPGTDTLTIRTGTSCGTTAANSDDAVTGSARQVTALYQIEGGGGLVNTCQES